MQAMVVEDSDVMRLLLTAALQRNGFRVREVRDVPEALESLDDAGPVDLIVTDHNLPGRSGLDLVTAVRARQDVPDVKVLMVSAEGHGSFVQRALSAGVDEYLFKPFTVDAVDSKIRLLGLPGASAGA